MSHITFVPEYSGNELLGLVQEEMEGVFDPSMEGFMIFHDTFEHYFEKTHRWFMDEYSENIAGEVVAMGHCLYYAEMGLDINLRVPGNRSGYELGAMYTTLDMMQDAIGSYKVTFGDEFLCNLPKSINAPFDIRYVSDMHWNEIMAMNHNNTKYGKSITFDKLLRCYHTGYKMAKRLVPNTEKNLQMLNDFIRFWNDFTENLKYWEVPIKKISINLHKKGKNVTWSAHVDYAYGSVVIQSTNLPRHLDFFDLVEESIY